jgi:hypothetical protein
MESAQDNTVAIVAIIATAGTALLSALLAAITAHRRQAGQLEHDRRIDDLEVLRGVLDDAAIAIGQAGEAIVNNNSRYSTLGNERWKEDRTTWEAFEAARGAIFHQDNRLAVRVGYSHPLQIAYRSLARTVNGAGSIWGEQDDEAKDKNPAQGEERFSYEERRRRCGATTDRFIEMRTRFMRLATQYAGVELPAALEVKSVDVDTHRGFRVVLSVTPRDPRGFFPSGGGVAAATDQRDANTS